MIVQPCLKLSHQSDFRDQGVSRFPFHPLFRQIHEGHDIGGRSPTPVHDDVCVTLIDLSPTVYPALQPAGIDQPAGSYALHLLED